MGVHVMHDNKNGHANLFCSTSDWAFGPVFSDDEDGHDAYERAESFLRWLRPHDARSFTDTELLNGYNQWVKQEAEQWAREEKEREDRYNYYTDPMGGGEN